MASNSDIAALTSSTGQLEALLWKLDRTVWSSRAPAGSLCYSPSLAQMIADIRAALEYNNTILTRIVRMNWGDLAETTLPFCRRFPVQESTSGSRSATKLTF